jgi:hypothetical protein
VGVEQANDEKFRSDLAGASHIPRGSASGDANGSVELLFFLAASHDLSLEPFPLENQDGAGSLLFDSLLAGSELRLKRLP